mmetsp:Transcript_7261/g.20591  ORF Transcript_7261/g.20591 Transcript_7261/m.20591 type:complete len:530 (-) Transcript_7261:525-2114(-)
MATAAVLAMPGAGHVNPECALAAALDSGGRAKRVLALSFGGESSRCAQSFLRAGPRVEYFDMLQMLPAQLLGALPQTDDIMEAMRSVGMEPIARALLDFDIQDGTLQSSHHEILMSVRMAYLGTLVLPQLIDFLRREEAQLVAYDPFFPFALAAAEHLGLPNASTIVFPGVHSLPPSLMLQAVRASRGHFFRWVNERYVRLSGVDVAEACGGMVFCHYSPHLNIINSIEDICLEPQPAPEDVGPEGEAEMRRLHAFYRRLPLVYVGPMLHPEARMAAAFTPKKAPEKASLAGEGEEALRKAPSFHRDRDNQLPRRELHDAALEGAKVVYVSFGSEAPNRGWDQGWTSGGAGEGQRAKGGMGGADSGKEYCQTLWGRLFDVLGNMQDVVVLISIGKHPEALRGMDHQVPANVFVRSTVPQLEVLALADVFVTHGGNGSVLEAFSHGVPMLVLPCFGDQPANCQAVARAGAGLGFLQPVQSATREVLVAALGRLLRDPGFRSAAQRVGEKLQAAGGAEQAAGKLLSLLQAP